MNFEKQIATIKDKSELHEWVDALPDGARGIVLCELPEGEEKWMRYREFGQITMAEALYFIKSYEHYLFDHITTNDE